jgi:wobble nucleotide-excising tRNase
VATFSEEGTTFENLQRVNYIFGENGAGKTTLSRLFATHFTKVNNGECLRGTGKYKECEVEWTGKPVKVLVYNKDFRDRNLKENIPGVFTLGEGSVDAENKLAKVKRELDEQNRSLHSK